MLTPSFENTNVVVIGDVMLDIYYWGKVERISPEAPVPVVRVEHKTNRLGGAGNVALNLARLGCRCKLLGLRGDDLLGRLLIRKLESEGIEAHLEKSPRHSTTSKTRIIGRGQQLLRIDDEAVGKLDIGKEKKMFKVFCQYAKRASAVVISDYGKAVFKGDLARMIISYCRKEGITVLADPKGRDWSRYKGANWLTPNWSEFLQAAGYLDLGGPFKAMAKGILDEVGLEHLLVTRGAKGMELFSRKTGQFSIESRAKEVFDVSGAGDTVIACLAAGLGAGLDGETAAAMANAAAGVVVGKLGTYPVTRKELEQALATDGLVGGGKIKSLEQAASITAAWQSQGKQVVFTNGCFDLLHVGHIRLLEEAAGKGDFLIVGLNSDASVRRLKGPSRPIIDQEQRAALLAGVNAVDMVVIFDQDTPLELIRRLKPQVIAKGGDYTVETVVGHELVGQWGGRVELIPLLEGISTSRVIASVKAKCG